MTQHRKGLATQAGKSEVRSSKAQFKKKKKKIGSEYKQMLQLARLWFGKTIVNAYICN